MAEPTRRREDVRDKPESAAATNPPKPGTQGADARGGKDKQRENQQRMGVTPGHKTEDMEEKHRGTFP